MTEPLTHRRVLAVAGPIVLSNATIPILGVVDTGVVGQLGEAAPIGAVGIGALTLSVVYWIFGFLRMGTTGMVAQARGAGDVAETGALMMRGIIVACAAGLFFIVTQAALFWGVFQLSPASAEVEALARDYLAIRIWGAPATIAGYVMTGWLIAMERTRNVLVLQVVMNGLNIGLDLLFVLKFGWGVEGVAIATLIAEWTGLALGLWLCRDAFSGDQWRNWPRIFDAGRLRHMAAVNGDILIRSVILETGFAVFLFWGAKFGDVTLAANQVLIQFLQVTAYALDGFAFAAEALVGTMMGMRNRAALRRAAIMCSQWGFGMAIVLASLFALLGPVTIDVMATSPEVRAAARHYLPWMVAAPVLGIASWMLDGIFIGATRTGDMRNAMLQSGAIYALALIILVPLFDNHGLWAALTVLNMARGFTLWLKYPALEAAAS